MRRHRSRFTTRIATQGRSARRWQAARLAGMRISRDRRSGRKDRLLFRTISVGLVFFGALIVGSIGATVAGGLAIWAIYSEDLPDLGSVEARQFATTRIFDRNGLLLYEVNDPQTGYRTYSSIDEITAGGDNMHIVNATVAAEDRTFWDNLGVDPLAIARGAIINITGEGTSGGSTITQQLVRQLYPDTIGYERSVDRKIREAIVAVQFTFEFEKEAILEEYLNTVYYGNRAYGIDAAARSYFNTSPGELTLAQASLLAGLPQAPSAYDPTRNLGAAKTRQRYVLDQMVEAGYITSDEAETAWEEVLVIYSGEGQEIRAPHWVNFVISELEQSYGAELVYRGGLTVRTTLDYELQQVAEQALRDHLATIPESNADTGAIVVMLPGTNEIVAMVGSRDYWDDSISGQFNVAVSERQPGSAFMPVVYAAAFEQGWGPHQVIFDYPVRFQTPGAPSPEFVPENVSGRFSGAVSAREALAQSINIPAVKALEYAGIGETIDLAHQLGIRTGLWRGLDFYGLALALGAGEVSPLELTTAYATFANAGRYVPPNPVLEITDTEGRIVFELERETAFERGQQVIRPETAYLIGNILDDDDNRRLAYGEGNPLEFPELGDRPVAAKTGTSFDWLDNWTVGYSSDLVVGVWVGNAGNFPLDELAGIDGAAPIFHRIMVEAHDERFADLLRAPDGSQIAEEFQRPGGIVEIEVCEDTGGLPDSDDNSYLELVDHESRPVTPCDQLTMWQWNELQAALSAFSDQGSRFTPEGAASLLRFAREVRGGIGVPDQPAEPTATPTSEPEPTATATPPPTATPRPTSTPLPSASPTPTEPQASPGFTIVPNIFGMSEEEAIETIEASGLEIGDIFYVTEDDLPPGVSIGIVDVGEVLLQTPAAGAEVPDFSEVSFAVRAE